MKTLSQIYWEAAQLVNREERGCCMAIRHVLYGDRESERKANKFFSSYLKPLRTKSDYWWQIPPMGGGWSSDDKQARVLALLFASYIAELEGK